MANILVCDDDKDIVEAIEIYLTQEGYHILKAYDGQEALDILRKSYLNLGEVLRTRTKSSDLTSVQMTTSPNLSIRWN